MPKLFQLSNGLKVVHEKMSQTPRITVNFFIKTGVIDEKKAGEATLITKLLLQGTKKLSAKELAEKIDLYAIDFVTDVKQDYMQIKTVFLNDDIETALELMSDVILNSTFANFKKEVNKLKGEITSDLDSARVKALDNLVKNLYENHPYGNTYTKVLDDVDLIKSDDVKNLYFSKLVVNNCVISVVGDIGRKKVNDLLEKYFSALPQKSITETGQEVSKIKKAKIVKIEKEDVAQAQIIKAWILSGVKSKDIPVMMVLNSILGSCGLSSRLFLELREKKGLAYVVRSSLDVMNLASTFSLYIATEPKNISVALQGFEEEVNKLKEELVSETELTNAKNNILGKRAYLHETNSHKAYYWGFYELIGLGYKYDSKIEKLILKVTPKDIQRVTKKYLNKKCVVSLLAPKKFLNEV